MASLDYHLLDMQSLLPPGTKIFYSSYRFTKLWYLSAWASLVTCLTFLCAATFAEGTTANALMIVTVMLVIGCFVALWYIHRRSRAHQEEAIKQNSWNEGVFVFPTGDVVCRFAYVFRSVDVQIEASHLLGADVVDKWSLTECAQRSYLRVHYNKPGTPEEIIYVGSHQLTGDVVAIAAAINESKTRSGLVRVDDLY